MNFYEAITKLNVLSSYDTTQEKREEYKKCINVILHEKENYDRVMCEPIQQIMHDLEILSILKKHLTIYEFTLIISMDALQNHNEFLKVKEWTINEKSND